MKKNVSRLFARMRSFRVFLLLAVLISAFSVGILASFSMQPLTIPLEVKDPINILDYPSDFSLFPGETKEFSITVENLASVNYSISLDFRLNDTTYQAKYITFSNENYTIVPGKQNLEAWLTIAPTAPPASVMITVNRKEDEQTPIPSPPPPDSSPTPSPTPELTPCMELLGGGARWAARNGTSALYINWKDNWDAHHLTDGAGWGPWPTELEMENRRYCEAYSLEQTGFNVDFAGDMPESLSDLSGYDLVVISANWATEPQHAPLIRDYIFNGGGVVILGGTPCYFTVYCKDMWPYRAYGAEFDGIRFDLAPIQEWFGTRYYVNTGGTATITIDNPFGTALSSGDPIIYADNSPCPAVMSPNNGAQTIALWNSGSIFAFTHEYGEGRVYYQAKLATIR